MVSALLDAVPAIELPHTELYLGASWVIVALVVVTSLQLATMAFVFLVYRELRELTPPGAAPASPTASSVDAAAKPDIQSSSLQ